MVQRNIFLIPVVLLFLLASATGGTAKTNVFLPLGIASAEKPLSYANLSDSMLEKQLDQAVFTLIPRAELPAFIGPLTTWPPPITSLQKLADKTNADNIAVGTLTILGDQLSLDVKLFDLLSPDQPTFYYATGTDINSLPALIDQVQQEMKTYLQKESKIATIAPAGNERIDSGAILRQIRTKRGDLYDQTALKDDLKAIFRMGYFNDVSIEVEDTDQGKEIIFRVVEKPVVKAIVFEGIDELKEEDVREAANVREHFILNLLQIKEATEAIKQLYKSKGYYNCAVTTDISYPDANNAVVKFVLDEGEKTYIKKISFTGNKTFDNDELLDQMETGERWFMSWLTDSGLLDMQKIQQDAQRIIAFYNNNGFLEAKISDPAINQKDGWIYIVFVIEEGPRFRVGTVDFSGDLPKNRQELLDLLSIRKEKYLNRQIVREDIMKLTDYYAESGYAFAHIRPIINKSSSGNRMDITFAIDKGNLVRFNRIIIKGNTRTRNNVIRRALKITEGGIFDSKAIRQSTMALQRLGFFEEAIITPEPATEPDLMNVIVQVKEKSTGTFSIGMGYSSADKLIFMGQISENNFLGRGDSLSLSANLSSKSSRFNLAYTNPHLNDSDLSFGVDLFNTKREYNNYTKESKGGGLRMGYPIFEKWRLYGNYSYTDTDLTEVSDQASYIIRQSVDLHITSALKFSLVRDTKDRFYNPSNGSRNVLSVKYAGGFLGGDAQFTKVEGSTSWYFPLFFKMVLHIKGAAGQVFENESDRLPVYERFYLGGLNSIRGFEYADISPIDPLTKEHIGGDKMWYTNTEIIFPLLDAQGIRGVVFYDAGQVLNDDEDFFENTEETIKQAVGLGIRWLSPLGPLRLVWGYNLDPEPDEDETVWDFSVGGSF